MYQCIVYIFLQTKRLYPLCRSVSFKYIGQSSTPTSYCTQSYKYSRIERTKYTICYKKCRNLGTSQLLQRVEQQKSGIFPNKTKHSLPSSHAWCFRCSFRNSSHRCRVTQRVSAVSIPDTATPGKQTPHGPDAPTSIRTRLRLVFPAVPGCRGRRTGLGGAAAEATKRRGGPLVAIARYGAGMAWAPRKTASKECWRRTRGNSHRAHVEPIVFPAIPGRGTPNLSGPSPRRIRSGVRRRASGRWPDGAERKEGKDMARAGPAKQKGKKGSGTREKGFVSASRPVQIKRAGQRNPRRPGSLRAHVRMIYCIARRSGGPPRRRRPRPVAPC